MQLRMVIAHKLFHDKWAREDPLSFTRLIDSDPYLSSLEDFRKPGAVQHLLEVEKQRDQWINSIKTAPAPDVT